MGVVDILSMKWSEVGEENRRKTVMNFLIELMGTGFWAATGGLGGRLESEWKSYYSNLSLMELYSSELNRLKASIDAFKAAVDKYNVAYTAATLIIESHHESHPQHASTLSIDHYVPSWEKKTCRENLPSFLCRGNHFVFGTCAVEFETPSKAFLGHQLTCGGMGFTTTVVMKSEWQSINCVSVKNGSGRMVNAKNAAIKPIEIAQTQKGITGTHGGP